MSGIWILRRYVTLEYLRWVAFCVLGFSMVALVVDLFNQAGEMVDHQVGTGVVIRYAVTKLPFFLALLIPPSLLMAMLISLSGMTRRNEVTAMLAGGIGRRSILFPMATLALLFSAADFFLEEYVVPVANTQNRYIWDVLVEGRSWARFSDRRNRWFFADGGFLRVEVIDPDQKTLHGVVFLARNAGSPATSPRLEAPVATWNDANKSWALTDPKLITVDEHGMMRVSRPDSAALPVSLKPEDLAAKVSNTEEWGVRDLRRIIQDRERLGQDVVKEKVDLQSRFAIPLAGLVMGLLGAPFAFREHRRGGVAISFATGVVIAFFYWVVLYFGMAIGKTGNLPPTLAAWMPNAIFGAAGLYLSSTLDSL